MQNTNLSLLDHPEPWCPLTPLCTTTQRVPQKIQNVQAWGR
ncbi:hypothetical protein FQN60_001654 [Etheostoma spectabile]|uniref:Uncharacterized protein n=1 Tax=Etheostoma spectabile TaxID=54343 RepID=A0A5J5D677_9PERO|nr:hypothetical protein FQN60_001654 [Etheostoma spectabile]